MTEVAASRLVSFGQRGSSGATRCPGRAMGIAARRTDTALIQQVQAGGRRELGELYRRFAPRAYRTALSVCHDRDCAQDAVQDAFVSIWCLRATYRPDRGPVLQWAMSIVRHRAIYLARRRSVSAGLDEGTARLEEQRARDDVPGEAESHAEAKQLRQLLLRLPSAQREVIRLAFFQGLTHEQIAHLLALPPGTVKGRMRLGLQKLRAGLGED
jgi:RNA polymerase sigma-70 factor, ECF subfamily